MDKVDDIDTDKTCDFILKYGEIEFIKTQYYKTPFHDEVAKTLLNIATLYEQCYPPMAEKYLKSILTIKEHIYLNDSAEVAKAHDALGDYYRIYMANFKRAIKEYVKAKRIRKKLYGIQDPRITENYERLALSLYYHSDKTGKAEKLLLDSIEIREKAFPNINFPLYIAYMDMGIHYSMKNTYSKSIIYLQKALKVFSGKTDSDYLAIVSQLSRDYLSHNDSHNALKYAEEGYRASKVFYKSDKHYRVLENCRHLDEIQKKVRK